MRNYSYGYFFYLFVFAFLLQYHTTYSQPISEKRNVRIAPLPALLYSPETRFGVGIAASAVFRIGRDTTSRKSNIMPYFIYTQNRQFLSAIQFTLFGSKEKWRSEGELAYFVFPELFFGVGNETTVLVNDLYTYNWLRLYHRSLRKLAENTFLGLVQEVVYMGNVSSDSVGKLAQEKPTGYDGAMVSGLGPCFVRDTRNNVLNPNRGYFVETFVTFYGKGMGSSHVYQKCKLEGRVYQSFSPKWIFAGQILARFSWGEVPFKFLSNLGGDQIMRGYYEGRFRGMHLATAQTELRWNTWRRFGMVCFVATGRVADKVENLALQGFKIAYGAGIRFNIDRKENYNIRLDYGIGQDMDGIYLNFGEAF